MEYCKTAGLLAVALGYIFFAEVPDRWTLLGAAVMIGSTLYIARREARWGQARPGITTK